MRGGTKCHIHGGKSRAGLASATFRTGRYSKYLPERLAARYSEAQTDDKLLELREDIALLDSRLAELVDGLDSGSTADLWRELRDTLQELQQASANGDRSAQNEAFAQMTSLIQRGGNEYAAWGEIYDSLERRRRLVESERKRLVEMQQMITSERAMSMLAAITHTIQTHVTDRETLAAISADLRQLTIIEPGG